MNETEAKKEYYQKVEEMHTVAYQTTVVAMVSIWAMCIISALAVHFDSYILLALVAVINMFSMMSMGYIKIESQI